MTQVKRSHTYVLELNGVWAGAFASEPLETAWAGEAVVFVRALEAKRLPEEAWAHVEISPDGLHWCAEGTRLRLAAPPEMTYCRLSHFGGWIRLAGELPEGGELKVIAYVALKE
jgi:hypothetical protein